MTPGMSRSSDTASRRRRSNAERICATAERSPETAVSAGEKVVVLNGVAKTYAMTGWRVGWMIGPTDIIKAASNLQSHSTSNVSNVAQVAALTAVSGNLSAVAEMRTG